MPERLVLVVDDEEAQRKVLTGFLRKRGYVEKGELVINIASMPIAEKGMANMLKLSPA